MKRFVTIRTMILGLTLLLGTLPVSVAERPIAGSGTGTATFITDEAGNVIGANVATTGNATHLGLFTGSGRVLFAPDPDDPNIVHPSGEATFIAANGDHLSIAFENGSQDLTTGIATAEIRFVSGTGRFDGASGTGQLVVVQNFATGAFEFTFVGRVNY